MKKAVGILGLLAMGVIGFFVLSEKYYRDMSYDDLVAGRKKALDDGCDTHSSRMKAFDWEINRRDNEIYAKENPTSEERVHREHAGIMKFDE